MSQSWFKVEAMKKKWNDNIISVWIINISRQISLSGQISPEQIVLRFKFYLKPLLSGIFFVFFCHLCEYFPNFCYDQLSLANISLFRIILLLIFNILFKRTKAHVPKLSSFTLIFLKVFFLKISPGRNFFPLLIPLLTFLKSSCRHSKTVKARMVNVTSLTRMAGHSWFLNFEQFSLSVLVKRNVMISDNIRYVC